MYFICQSVGPHGAFSPCCTDWWQLPEFWLWEMVYLSEEHRNTTPRTSGHATGAAEKSGKPNSH